ncbi:MAG: hypothetical protein ACFFAH_17455 [Promethearchaeota archaeon]
MLDLNKLTVKYIEKIAQDCNITLKKNSKKVDKINTILNAGISNKILSELFNNYLSEYNASKQLKTNASNNSSANIVKLKDKIEKLEEKIGYLCSIINNSNIDCQEEIEASILESGDDLSNIKTIIKTLLKPGKLITVDHLIRIDKLQKFPIKSIELAVKDLIHKRVINAFDGYSIQKLDGTIGLLSREN